MSQAQTEQITQLLKAVGGGNSAAQQRLWRLVYAELRMLAQVQVAREGSASALQPTTLVHEAFLRLMPFSQHRFENRRHFFAAAAKAMQRIRVDDARRRMRQKRGGGAAAARLVEEPPVFDQDPGEVLAINDALARLGKQAPRQADIVTLRYFAGLTVNETADALGLSPKTVSNEWRLARAWLYRELTGQATDPAGEERHTE